MACTVRVCASVWALKQANDPGNLCGWFLFILPTTTTTATGDRERVNNGLNGFLIDKNPDANRFTWSYCKVLNQPEFKIGFAYAKNRLLFSWFAEPPKRQQFWINWINVFTVKLPLFPCWNLNHFIRVQWTRRRHTVRCFRERWIDFLCGRRI